MSHPGDTHTHMTVASRPPTPLALDAVTAEMPEEDAQLQVDGAGGLSTQAETIGGTGGDGFGVSELGSPPHQTLAQPFPPGPPRAPGDAGQRVAPGGGRYVTKTVTQHLAAPQSVLVPDLQVQLGPTWGTDGHGGVRDTGDDDTHTVLGHTHT